MAFTRSSIRRTQEEVLGQVVIDNEGGANRLHSRNLEGHSRRRIGLSMLKMELCPDITHIMIARSSFWSDPLGRLICPSVAMG